MIHRSEEKRNLKIAAPIKAIEIGTDREQFLEMAVATFFSLYVHIVHMIALILIKN